MLLVGNRLSFLCKSKPPLIIFKVLNCNWRLRQHYKPNTSFSFGGFAFHQLKNKTKNMASPCHAAAGFAIDRLEGDSIKQNMLCIQLPKKRWLSSGTAAIKKTISYAGWDGIVFFIACGVGYLTLMPVIRFFFVAVACLHEHG